MNIYSGSKDWKERILSNFAFAPFTIEINGQEFECASVEGFWQGLKCEGDRRLYVFKLCAMAAKKVGADKTFKEFEIAGQKYIAGSEEHENLIREAIKQKILQNTHAYEALKQSKGAITHNVPGESKPIIKMEKLLMSVRKELFGY